MLIVQPFAPRYVLANPEQGTVTHGSAVVTGEGSDHMTIHQSSERAVIEWDDFSVGANERVDFIQPSASSVTANKVTGTNPSQILGQVSATGKLLIINGNGVVFGQNSVIDAAAFIASTHDISAEDVMNGMDSLDFSGGTASIINNGNIALRDGGIAALLAPHIVNNGVITARLGTVSLAASQSVSIDFYGDGLLSFAADSALRTGLSDSTQSLIDHQGQIIADGGLVQMTTRAASDIINQSVNIGGLVQARHASSQDGRIILSGDGAVMVTNEAQLDASGGGGEVSLDGAMIAHGGTIDASASSADGGTVRLNASGKASLSGVIAANSQTGNGGQIRISAQNITENGDSRLDVSGGNAGGQISVTASQNMMTSGTYEASASAGNGGTIDVSARDLRALSASFEASGSVMGGGVRIGGAFQGGKDLDLSQSYIESFVTRWPDNDILPNAAKTFLNDGTHINVSSASGEGGTAIIWSDVETTFLGSLNATGTSGGSAEISSAATLRYVSLADVNVGDGTLLLDPKNITIGTDIELQSWAYQGLIGRWYRPDVDVNSLDTDDEFGAALALSNDNTLLAVGAPGDDATGVATTNAGAVYLFTFTNSDFAGGALAGVIGKGYSNGDNVNVSTLDANDNFGTSVAFDSDGDRLAVGATGDDASGGGTSNAGAVYLFSFDDTDFSGGNLDATIGSGYTDLSVTLDADDLFGTSVALSDDGTRMVVGASGAAGDGNTVSGSGAVYMMSFSDANYSSPSVVGIIGVGYKGSNDLHVSNLGAGDRFGTSVAVSANNTRLVVGAPHDQGMSNSGSADAGALYVFSFENNNYKTPTWEATLGEGYKGENDQDVTLDANDNFGSSVALSSNGLLIAVGAPGDDGMNASGSIDYGAVHLFQYNSTDLTNDPNMTEIGFGYTGTDRLDIGTLSNGDNFGASVALNGNGNRLAVGATSGDGDGGSTDGGELTLISFTNNSFGSPAISGLIGEGYSGNDYANNVNIGSDENLGISVSLSNDNTRMVVGSVNDGGTPDSSTNYGSVSLYSFTDSNFSNAVLEGTIGYGYAGSKDFNFNSGGGDSFGQSVSLSGDASRLAVGEMGEGGKGAVRLFSFTDSSFSSASLTGTVGDGFSGGSNVSVTLDSGDDFGSGVSLSDNARLLVVGAPGDDGTAGSNSGAVYLYRFTDGDFGGGTASGTMGSGYSNTGDVGVTLASGDRFGASVSLDGDGNRLAVGATGDEGPDSNQGAGAVLLFSFGDTSFTGGSLSATIGDGYTGGQNVDVTNLGKLDAFGTSVSLNGAGDRLAVGAPGDDTTEGTNTGAVYYFSFNDTDFTSGTLRQLFGSGYTSANQFDVSTLNANDAFGTSVALNDSGDRLVVGATGDDGGYDGEENVGVVHLFNASHASGGYRANGQTFSNLPSSSVTLAAYEIADILARGTDLTLQASNDISVNQAVQVGGFAQSPGGLTMRAGRSIAINQNITTNGGDISLFANDTAGNGVVAAQRDAGAGRISLAASRSINAGGGDISLVIANATDRTNNTSGPVTIGTNASITGNSVTIRNEGTTTGSDVTVATGGQISASSSGNAIIVVADQFNNSAGASVLNPLSGRYQLWTDDDTGYSVTELNPDFIQYGATYGSSSILGGGSEDGVFYTDTATVSPNFRSNTTKTYDGSNSVTVADADIGVSGANTGESVVLSAASASFDNENVGTGKTVTLTGLTIASASRGSIDIYGYGLSSTTASNANGTITAKALSLTGQSGTDKVYDRNTSATVSYGSLSGVVGGDTVTLDTSSAVSNFDNPNVGTNKAVTITNLALSGADSSNYTIGQQATTADITAATVTLVSASADDKTYDGNVNATISSYGGLSGVLGADIVNLDPSSVSSSFDTKNAGSNKTVTLTGLAITGSSAANYTIASSATTTANIAPKALTITAPSASDKTYDATNTASVTGGTLSGFISSETVTATPSGTFDNVNVGTGRTVTVTYSLNNGNGGGLASNYSLASGSTTADITAKALTISAPNAADKTYDGSTSATVTAGSLSGLVGDQTLTVTPTGTFDDKNVGTGKTVTVSYNLTNGTNGGLASNYSLAAGSTTADVSAKALTITAPTTTNKTYDGTNAITVTAGNLSGFVNSETVTATASGTTSDGNAGTGKYVTVSYNLANGNGGGLASNYSLANGSGSVNISPKTLTMTTISVADKIYDGDNSASVSATGLTGFVNSETVTALVQGNFADANAGSNKNVSVTFALANGTNGGKANNYQLASVTRQADITQKALSISGTSVSDKIYDATTNASVTTGTVTGLVGTQTLGITSTGSFANAAVGNGKTVSVSYNLANGTNGGLASNYSLAGQSQSADISFRALGLSGTVIANKTYDGSDTANITSVGSLTNIAGSDDVSLDSSGVSAKFDSINAGTQTVTLTGLSLTGSTASNYSFTLPSVSGVISKKALQITNSVALSKSYDANRVAVINPGTLSGFVGSQTVEVDASGLFANAQPGKDKSVLVTYYLKNGINGGLASNYSLSGETLTADIEGRTKEKADITAPMVEKQVEIVKNDVKIEREEKLEMIEQVELKVLEQETVSSAFVDTVGDWTILSCETSSANQGMCSAK